MTPDTYYLRAVKAPPSERDDEIVTRIVVEADQTPITDAELASKGGKQRNLVLAILQKDDPLLPSPIPAGEERAINSLNSYPHPFHIHVNDSYVVKVNGEAVTPFWTDTLPVPPNGSITFRMRFTDFTGKYVWQCHALNHEDLGMMQLVEVV